MKGILAYLKGFVGGGLFLITLLFVVVGIALGFANRGAPEDSGLLERMAIIIGLVIAFAAGGSCYWAAVRMFRGPNAQALDLRCFLGGYPLLAAGIISFIAGAHNFVEGDYHAAVALSPIVPGICWLWVAVKLFRGNSEPVASLWYYLGGNLMLFISTFSSFVIYDKYIGSESNGGGELYFDIFCALVVFTNGTRLLVYGKSSSEKSAEEKLEDQHETEVMTKHPNELRGFLTALALVAATAAFLTVALRVTANNCMRELAEGKNLDSAERDILQRQLENGKRHKAYGKFFALSKDNCNKIKSAGEARLEDAESNMNEKLKQTN